MTKRKGIEMKRGLITFATIFFAISTIMFSGYSETTAQPIKIGGSLPATGIHTETSKWIKQGYDFWVEDVNKRGGLLGRPVKMTIYPDQGNPEEAVAYYERAITVDKVDLVFGGYPGTSNVALMPLVEKYGKVFVGMGAHMKSFEQGFTYSFASPPLMSDWVYLSFGGVLDDLIPKPEWPKSIALLTSNNVMGLAARGNIIKAMEERGVKVVVDETYNLPLSDATPLVNRAKGRGAEILCCLSFFDDAVMIMRAAKNINYNPKLIFQQLASIVPAWMTELGEDGNNVVNSAFWHARLPFPGNSEINEGARTRLGIPAGPLFFGFGYCWMKTLEVAVQGAGTLDQKKVRDYLRSNKLDLPYGKGITFDSRGLPTSFCYGVQTTGGKVELVWPKSIATTKFVYPRPAWSK
jgi:branched-chain amino acid transport system substrate-binding protein